MAELLRHANLLRMAMQVPRGALVNALLSGTPRRVLSSY